MVHSSLVVFSSHLFVYYFLPLALVVYYVLPRPLRHLGLTLLSYLFYGWANPIFVVVMLTSTLIDYVCGLVITQQFGQAWSQPIRPLDPRGPRNRRQRAALVVSICSNPSRMKYKFDIPLTFFEMQF